MTLRGSVETIGLVDLLQVIQGNGHAGTLKVVTGDLTSKLYFWKGQLYLPTAGAGGALKIGALLVRARKLTGRDLLRALALQAAEGGGERLGEILVREGLVKKDDLDALIRRQFEEEIYDLLFRDGAYFEWRRDVLPAGFADAKGKIHALAFDTRSILMEASRRQDEWRRIRSQIPSTKAVYRLARAHEPRTVSTDDVIEGVTPGGEVLPPDGVMAQRALDALRKGGSPIEESPFDGCRSIEDVVALTNLTAFEALGIIARLRDEGVVRPIAAPEIEPRALNHLAHGRGADAYKLYAWANDVERLRPIAGSLDKELLKGDALKQGGRPAFAGRTGGARALTVLSRLLRRGSPFHFHAREEESAIDVYLTTKLLRLHLVGPRRTHSATRYLRSRGILSEDDLKSVRENSKRTHRDLDRVLLEDKLVTRDAWLLAVKDKVVSAMFSIFEWSEPFLEVSADPLIPPAGTEPRGLVVELPLDDELREDLRKDLLRWKSLVEVVPSPDVIFTCSRPTPEGELKRTHDLLDGRRAVADLLALAKVAPLELVRFLFDALLDQRIRRLTDKEHKDRLEAAVRAGRPDDAIAYAKSAVAFGFSPTQFQDRLIELRQQRKGMPSLEGRPTVQGELGQVSLAEVLQLLQQGKRTGTLRIQDTSTGGEVVAGRREQTLYLDGGDLFVLIVEGAEPAPELKEMLGESATERLGMGALLKERGHVKEDDVATTEIERIKNRIFEAFLWEGARFEFLQNVLPPELRSESQNATKIALKTDLLLFEAMQRLAEWDDMRTRLRSSRAVFRFASTDAKSEAVMGERGSLAYLFDGQMSLADVVRHSGEERYRVYKLAAALVGNGALVFSHMKEAGAASESGSETPTKRVAASGRFLRVPPRGETAPPRKAPPEERDPAASDSITSMDLTPSRDSKEASGARRWGEPPKGPRATPSGVTRAASSPPPASPPGPASAPPTPPPLPRPGKAPKKPHVVPAEGSRPALVVPPTPTPAPVDKDSKDSKRKSGGKHRASRVAPAAPPAPAEAKPGKPGKKSGPDDSQGRKWGEGSRGR